MPRAAPVTTATLPLRSSLDDDIDFLSAHRFGSTLFPILDRVSFKDELDCEVNRLKIPLLAPPTLIATSITFSLTHL
jgi:hypothetical protein